MESDKVALRENVKIYRKATKQLSNEANLRMGFWHCVLRVTQNNKKLLTFIGMKHKKSIKFTQQTIEN